MVNLLDCQMQQPHLSDSQVHLAWRNPPKVSFMCQSHVQGAYLFFTSSMQRWRIATIAFFFDRTGSSRLLRTYSNQENFHWKPDFSQTWHMWGNTCWWTWLDVTHTRDLHSYVKAQVVSHLGHVKTIFVMFLPIKYSENCDFKTQISALDFDNCQTFECPANLKSTNPTFSTCVTRTLRCDAWIDFLSCISGPQHYTSPGGAAPDQRRHLLRTIQHTQKWASTAKSQQTAGVGEDAASARAGWYGKFTSITFY